MLCSRLTINARKFTKEIHFVVFFFWQTRINIWCGWNWIILWRQCCFTDFRTVSCTGLQRSYQVRPVWWQGVQYRGDLRSFNLTCCCCQTVVASLFSHAANISGAIAQHLGTGLPVIKLASDGCWPWMLRLGPLRPRFWVILTHISANANQYPC